MRVLMNHLNSVPRIETRQVGLYGRYCFACLREGQNFLYFVLMLQNTKITDLQRKPEQLAFLPGESAGHLM